MGSQEMAADRLGTGVEAPRCQLLAKPHDLVLVAVAHLGGRALRPPRARLEPCLPVAPVPGEQLVEPGAMHPVRLGELAERPSGPEMRLDEKATLVHRSTPTFGLSYVLTQVSPMS